MCGIVKKISTIFNVFLIKLTIKNPRKARKNRMNLPSNEYCILDNLAIIKDIMLCSA